MQNTRRNEALTCIGKYNTSQCNEGITCNYRYTSCNIVKVINISIRINDSVVMLAQIGFSFRVECMSTAVLRT